MANSISGKIIEITPIIYVNLRDGSQSPKRRLILDTATINPTTGIKGYENPLAFELFGESRVAMISQLVVGQDVDVSFNLRGRRFVGNDGQVRYFVDLDAFSVVVQSGNTVSQPQPSVQMQQPQARPAMQAQPQPAPYQPQPQGYTAQPYQARQPYNPQQSNVPQQDSDLPF